MTINKIFLFGAIGNIPTENGILEGVCLPDIQKQYNRNATEIHLFIDSIGGIVQEGDKIIDFLLSTKKPIKTIIVGNCYSCATKISLLPDNKKDRLMSSGAKFMIHDPALADNIDCVTNYCNPDYIGEVHAMLKKEQNKLVSYYLKKTKLDKAVILDLMRNEEFIDFKKCMDLGFVGGLYEITEDTYLQNKIFNIVNNFIFKFEMEKNEVKQKIEEAKEKSSNLLKQLLDYFTGKDKEEKEKARIKAKIALKATVALMLDNGAMIYVDSEDGELVGKMAYTADQMPVSEGTHKLVDGRSIVVDASGMVTAVNEAEATATANTQTTEQAVTELANIQKQNKELEDNLEAMKAYLAGLQGQSLKTEGSNPNPVIVTNKGKEMTKKEHALKQLFLHNAQKLGLQYRKDIPEKDIRRGEMVVKNANVLESSFSYTYDGIQDLNEMFYQPVINAPDFKSLFRVMTGVKSKQQLYFVGALSKLVKKYDNTCQVSSDYVGALFTNKELETVKMGFDLTQCAGVFEGVILEEWLKTGADMGDLTGTQLETILMNVITSATSRDLFRIFSFGDDTAPSDDYNQLEGLWSLLFNGLQIADSSNGGYCTVRTDSGITSFGTNDASNSIIYYLRRLLYNSDNLLKAVPKSEKTIHMTQNAYEALQVRLQDKSYPVDASVLFSQDTDGLIRFDGIKINPIVAWDESLQDADNPYHSQYNMLMLYTADENWVVGIDGQNDDSQIKLWYDINTDTNKIRLRTRMGIQYKHCKLSSIATGKLA